MSEIIKDWFLSIGFIEQYANYASAVITIIAFIILAWIGYLFTIKSLMRSTERIILKTKTQWDDILLNSRVLHKLSYLVPAIILYYGITFGINDYPKIIELSQTAIYLYIVIVSISVINALINGFHDIYQTMPIAKDRPVKGFVQVIKIFVYVLGFGLVFSILLQKNLTSFFAGLGAMAAVIMLIFKDSIQGFVAGIQLSANNMVRIGDWISMPSRKADGTVIDISLNTVKVQNWDKTISTIPPYAMISESFTNWRGMEESGGRRIKRSLYIDMRSIHFLSQAEIVALEKVFLIKDYIKQRKIEIENYNKKNDVDESMPVNGRRLTNIGTFRKYVEEYLKQNINIHSDMTFLVRQLQPTDKGLPLEIYVFSKEQRWAYYESIQADIFDHLLSVISQFSLSIYQNPSGNDLAKFIESKF